MAIATKKLKTIETPVTVIQTTQVPDGVILELSQEEAEALRILFQFVGGPPDSYRGKIESIITSLYTAGVTLPDGYSDRVNREKSGSVYFK